MFTAKEYFQTMMFTQNKINSKREVVVILPYVGEKVLMQLRDFKKRIAFPGQWGFFGGAIEKGETPNETAERELYEEIGYRSAAINQLNRIKMPELGNIISYSFCCQLTVSVSELVLNEGMDFGLFSLKDVMNKHLYSEKLEKYFPVIPSNYIAKTFKEFLSYRKNKGTKNGCSIPFCSQKNKVFL